MSIATFLLDIKALLCIILIPAYYTMYPHTWMRVLRSWVEIYLETGDRNARVSNIAITGKTKEWFTGHITYLSNIIQ